MRVAFCLCVSVSFAIAEAQPVEEMREFRIVDLSEGVQVYGGGLGEDPSEWHRTNQEVIVLRMVRPNGRASTHTVRLRPGVQSTLTYERGSALQPLTAVQGLVLPGSVQYRGGRKGVGLVLGGAILASAGTAYMAESSIRSRRRSYEEALTQYEQATTEAETVRWREATEEAYGRIGEPIGVRDAATVAVAVVYAATLLDAAVNHTRRGFAVRESVSLQPSVASGPGVSLRLQIP
ncbi:MAG: hypothetical protein AAF791_03550 [Bacteroidota bacterium]